MEEKGETTSSAMNRESLALIRSLARHAAERADFIEFAKQCCLDDLLMNEATRFLDENQYRALTESGTTVLEKLEVAFKQVLDFETSTFDSFNQLEWACSFARDVVNQSNNALLDMFVAYPDILSLDDCLCFERFLSNYILALCRFVSVYYGSDELACIREFVFRRGKDSFNDICIARKRINVQIQKKSAQGAWMIKKTESGDGFLQKIKGFVLSPVNESIDNLAQHEHLEKVAFNIYASPFEENSIAYLGFGNLIGTTFEESYKLRAAGVHTVLPIDAFPLDACISKNPLVMIENYFHDNVFCVSPENFVLALDRFARCRAFELNKGSQEFFCLDCGEPSGKKGFCRKHRW